MIKYLLQFAWKSLLARNSALIGILAGAVCVLAVHVTGREVIGMSALQISSPVFKHDQMIPSKYTCDGADASPPLLIGNVPPQARSLALIVDDPDAPAGTWVHWVVWNIDPKTTEIGENTVPAGAHQGTNDFRTQRYGGPCPPSGTHRYFFKLYALDATIDPGKGATKAGLERAMKGHIAAQAELMGRYKRK
jgi:Raf kinase inhibitor-like YbhB/YbcL family protein